MPGRIKVRLCNFVIAVAVSAGALAVGGCDSGGDAPQKVTKRVKPNPFQDKLLALNDRDRMLALKRAVQDDAGQCPRISGSTYQQDYQGMAMWVAHCSNREWAVYLSPSGIVQVRACSEAKQLGLPECAASPGKGSSPDAAAPKAS
ncbi:MAG: hypothetical protein JWN69_1198 [Alphaproteobacteria bacterium]|nr:hypothetical protein [Alphaproteobacteria bacterium]